VVAVFALSFYLTVGRDGVERFLRAILPSAYERKALHIYSHVSGKIGKWLTGQLIISAVVGLITFLGLWLLGVRYSLLLGFLAAIAELVPYVGPIITGSIAILIGLSDSVPLGIYVFILFIIIQQLENNVLLPVVMRYTTTLNPVIILTALLIGGKVFGIVGLVLAIPFAVLVQEIIEDWVLTKEARKGII
jgi:predicted PurR-regulated permease PerM